MIRTLVLLSGLLLCTHLSAAQISMSFAGEIPAADKVLLAEAVGSELADELDIAVRAGNAVTVKFEAGVGLDRGPCEVTIKESKSGSGSVKADVGRGRVGNAEARGSGQTTREITVKGPCDQVSKIVREIRRNP